MSRYSLAARLTVSNNAFVIRVFLCRCAMNGVQRHTVASIEQKTKELILSSESSNQVACVEGCQMAKGLCH